MVLFCRHDYNLYHLLLPMTHTLLEDAYIIRRQAGFENRSSRSFCGSGGSLSAYCHVVSIFRNIFFSAIIVHIDVSSRHAFVFLGFLFPKKQRALQYHILQEVGILEHTSFAIDGSFIRSEKHAVFSSLFLNFIHVGLVVHAKYEYSNALGLLSSD